MDDNAVDVILDKITGFPLGSTPSNSRINPVAFTVTDKL